MHAKFDSLSFIIQTPGGEIDLRIRQEEGNGKFVATLESNLVGWKSIRSRLGTDDERFFLKATALAPAETELVEKMSKAVRSEAISPTVTLRFHRGNPKYGGTAFIFTYNRSTPTKVLLQTEGTCLDKKGEAEFLERLGNSSRILTAKQTREGITLSLEESSVSDALRLTTHQGIADLYTPPKPL